MRLLRCGCGLLSLVTMLPILLLLLLLGGAIVLLTPQLVPGPVRGFADGVRQTATAFVLGGEVGTADLSLQSVDLSPKNGGTATLTLETKADKAPDAKSLAPALKAVGNHLDGPLALSADPLARVVVVIRQTPGDKTLLTLSVAVSDLRAYAAGKLTTAAFMKKVASTP